MTKRAKQTQKRKTPKKKTAAKKVGTTKKAAGKKKPSAKKKRAKNAKPLTYEEAHWGWQGDPYFMDLALRLTDSLAHAPGTPPHKEGVDLVTSEVIDLLSRDASFLSGEDNLGDLARAIQVVNEQKMRAHQPWNRPSENELEFRKQRRQWAIAYRITRELESGERDRSPTVGEFREMLEVSGCPLHSSSNATKMAKFAGWTPTESKRGPRSRK